eukprot:scaffold19488_cov119-Isochrysis_galbana.AAC.1
MGADLPLQVGRATGRALGRKECGGHVRTTALAVTHLCVFPDQVVERRRVSDELVHLEKVCRVEEAVPSGHRTEKFGCHAGWLSVGWCVAGGELQ